MAKIVLAAAFFVTTALGRTDVVSKIKMLQSIKLIISVAYHSTDISIEMQQGLYTILQLSLSMSPILPLKCT